MMVESRQQLLNESQICNGKAIEYEEYIYTCLNNYTGSLPDWLRLFACRCYKHYEYTVGYHNTFFISFASVYFPEISLGDYKNYGHGRTFTMSRAINIEQWNKMSLLDIYDVAVSVKPFKNYQWDNLIYKEQDGFDVYTALHKNYIWFRPANKKYSLFITGIHDEHILTNTENIIQPYIVCFCYYCLSPVKLYQEDLFIYLLNNKPGSGYLAIISGEAVALTHSNTFYNTETYMNVFAFFVLFGNGRLNSIELPYDDYKYSKSFGKIVFDNNVDYFSLIKPSLINYYSKYSQYFIEVNNVVGK